MPLVQTESFTIRRFVHAKLKVAVEREIPKLRKAYAASDLSEIAWRSRNLFELYVWAAFCLESEEAAKSFRDDGARDVADLVRKVPPELQGLDFVQRGKVMIEGGKTFDLDFDRGYTTVANASQQLQFGSVWSFFNKLFSKYAHPTALVVMHEEDNDQQGLRDMIFELGVKSGAAALDLIQVALSQVSSTHPNVGDEDS